MPARLVQRLAVLGVDPNSNNSYSRAHPYALLAHNGSTEFGTDMAAALDRPVSSIATKYVITVNVNDDLGRISAVLADKHLKKAPVVTDDGIINRSDINRYLVSTFVPVAG
ncbi:CBS domain-containing protein [Corynebacterium hadale]|uniref:CBS domain-containing protein n=1 Tax=Corynebacterium hadale TaxID=2026255 RepID=UPI000BAA7673|nr:CBS domain-containing protein [Corynebacterium hadale]PAT12821.1 hypothetical protein CKJ83_06040 [Corynebacterium hadale]